MNQAYKTCAIKLGFCFGLMLGSMSALSADSDVTEIDSVLDRLEKKLDDQRSEVLEPYKIIKKNEANLGQFFSSEPVPANLEEFKKIGELSEEINRLDSDLKSLTEKVNTQAMGLTENSKMMPRATIHFQGPDDGKLRTKYLRVLLNEVPLFEYRLAQSSAMLPSKFKVYEGSLPQGNHILKVEGVWARSSSKLLADEDLSWSFEKKYDLKSEGGAVAKQYSLVTGQASQGKKMEVTLRAGEPQ
jgi:hypothetical protein